MFKTRGGGFLNNVKKTVLLVREGFPNTTVQIDFLDSHMSHVNIHITHSTNITHITHATGEECAHY